MRARLMEVLPRRIERVPSPPAFSFSFSRSLLQQLAFYGMESHGCVRSICSECRKNFSHESIDYLARTCYFHVEKEYR